MPSCCDGWRERRRGLGAGRRAVPRAGPRRSGAGCLRQRLRGAGQGAPGVQDHARDLFRRARRQSRRQRSSLPVAGLHVDLVRAPEQLDAVLTRRRPDLVLSLGVVDGRNIWRADLRRCSTGWSRWSPRARRCMLAPSCSLLQSPIDLAPETKLDPEIRAWLAFAVQKIEELATLGRALNVGRARSPTRSEQCRRRRRPPGLASDPRPGGAGASGGVDAELGEATAPFAERVAQSAPILESARAADDHHRLFPQTAEVRRRAPRTAKASSTTPATNTFLREETDARGALAGGDRARRAGARRVRAQRHGAVFRRAACRLRLHAARLGAELWLALRAPADHLRRRLAPRADDGRWCALRPVADRQADEGHADRPGDDPAMVVRARRPAARGDLPPDRAGPARRGGRSGAAGAQSSRSTSRRCARACRCAAPTGRATWTGRWSASGSPPSGAADETQIHTHMCYSEFNDIIDAIAALDADVISIETLALEDGAARRVRDLSTIPTRSAPASTTSMRRAFPSVEEMTALLQRRWRAAVRRPAVGQPRLRTQDPQLGRSEAGADQHGRGGQSSPRRPGLSPSEPLRGGAPFVSRSGATEAWSAVGNVADAGGVPGARNVGHVPPADDLAYVRLHPEYRIHHLECDSQVRQAVLNDVDAGRHRLAAIRQLNGVATVGRGQAEPGGDRRSGDIRPLLRGLCLSLPMRGLRSSAGACQRPARAAPFAGLDATPWRSGTCPLASACSR